MATTEVQETSLGHTGTWTTDTNTGHSGGTALLSSTPASTATYTGTFRSLYLITATRKSGCVFTVAIDGGPAVTHHLANTMWSGDVPIGYRTLYPLVRGIADVSHTITITVVSGNVYIDSLVLVSGARLVATPGILNCYGDSWTGGTGATTASMYYPNVLQQAMQQLLHRPITLTDTSTTALGSERLWAVYVADGSGQRPGGMYRAVSLCISGTAPEFITYLYGYNDITSGTARPFDMWRHTHAVLALFEDALDVVGPAASITVAWGTPGYASPGVLNFGDLGLNSGSGDMGFIADVYEECVLAVRQAVSAFPWVRLADVFAGMDYRQGFVTPNAGADYGIHPNDPGHNLLAMLWLMALTGVQV